MNSDRFLDGSSQNGYGSSGLCLEEVALFVRLDGEHPSSGHIIFRFDLPHVNEIKNLIINQGFALNTFCFSNLVLPELMLSFRARDLILALAPAVFPQVAMQRSNMSPVRQSTLFGTSTFVLPESLVTSLRHNDPCTHGIVIKLQTSCCSPFSAVTEENDPAAAAYLCLWRHCSMHTISQNAEICVEHCLSTFIRRVVKGSWSLRTGCWFLWSLMKR